MTRFPTTTWHRLELLRGEDEAAAQEALANLSERYWLPLYGFLRRKGTPPHDAADLVQSFFLTLFETDGLAAADQARGRFRSFLMTAAANFRSNQGRYARAARRSPPGGYVAIDTETAEHRLAAMAKEDEPPELLFDREWAMALIEGAIDHVIRSDAEAGSREWIESALPLALNGADGGSVSLLAERAGLSQAATKMRLSRLRKRFARVLRDRVRETVETNEQVEPELRYLLRHWSRAKAEATSD